MEAFTVLRMQARERRDKLIASAQADYAATLTRIAAIEQDLRGDRPSTYQGMAISVGRAIPTDRPFTSLDVMAALEAMDSKRAWQKRTVDNQIGRLCRQGIIRRLRRSKLNKPALYVRCGVDVSPLPYEGKTLIDVLLEALSPGRAMTLTELAVALKEAGYPTAMTVKSLRTAIGAVVRGDRRFQRRGEKWAVA